MNTLLLYGSLLCLNFLEEIIDPISYVQREIQGSPKVKGLAILPRFRTHERVKNIIAGPYGQVNAESVDSGCKP